MVSGMDRQDPRLIRSLEIFREHVKAGRADETLRLDPRSRGNKASVCSLVEEIIHIFMTCDCSKITLEALMQKG